MKSFVRRFSFSDQSTLLTQAVLHPRFQVLLITFLATVMIFSKLGGSGLANYDDCFYAQKAKEILQTGSWMTMHYNHEPAFENSPFFLWMIAISYKIFGISEFAAKFPSALMGVATILLVYALARRLYNNWTAFFAAFILSTTFIFTRYARHAMIDVTLTFFVCSAFLALTLALRQNRRFFLLWGLCISICILAKSVLGFFPLLITGILLIVTKRWRTFRDINFWAGVAIILVIGFSWYIHEYLFFGNEFLDIHFGWLIMHRGLGLEGQSWYDHLSYLDDLLTYYWPWLPLFATGLVVLFRRALKKDENALLLLLWVLTIITVMSLMQSRVLWYIMPVFPAAAIISSTMIDYALPERFKILAAKVFVVLAAIAFLALNMTPVRLEADREPDVRILAPYVRALSDSGVTVAAFRQDYYGLNNSLLFYSDHAAFPILNDTRDLSHFLMDSARKACILPRSELDTVHSIIPAITILRTTDELALISNGPLDISGVKPLAQ